jgi:hypothetical protein
MINLNFYGTIFCDVMACNLVEVYKHHVTFQKVVLFIVTTVRMSDHTVWKLFMTHVRNIQNKSVLLFLVRDTI